VINGVFWWTRRGAPWRGLPTFYGNWKTAYSRHRRWSGDRTWVKILDRLRAGCDVDEGSQWTVGASSSTVRAYQHAGPARAMRCSPPGGRPWSSSGTSNYSTGSPCSGGLGSRGRLSRHGSGAGNAPLEGLNNRERTDALT
jgi:transposase